MSNKYANFRQKKSHRTRADKIRRAEKEDKMRKNTKKGSSEENLKSILEFLNGKVSCFTISWFQKTRCNLILSF